MPLFKRMTHKFCTRPECPNRDVPQPVGFYVCPEPTCSQPLAVHYETSRAAVALASSLTGLLAVFSAWAATQYVKRQAQPAGLLATAVCSVYPSACASAAPENIHAPAVANFRIVNLTRPDENASAGDIRVAVGDTYADPRSFQTGDRFRWELQTDARFVYLWLENGTGGQRLSVACAPHDSGPYNLELPTDASHSFQMGKDPGKERFLLVFSHQPVTALDGPALPPSGYQGVLDDLRRRPDTSFYRMELNHQ